MRVAPNTTDVMKPFNLRILNGFKIIFCVLFGILIIGNLVDGSFKGALLALIGVALTWPSTRKFIWPVNYAKNKPISSNLLLGFFVFLCCYFSINNLTSTVAATRVNKEKQQTAKNAVEDKIQKQNSKISERVSSECGEIEVRLRITQEMLNSKKAGKASFNHFNENELNDSVRKYENEYSLCEEKITRQLK